MTKRYCRSGFGVIKFREDFGRINFRLSFGRPEFRFSIHREAICGAFIAIFIEKTVTAAQDICDTSDWKTSQRRLKRGGFIKDDTIVRISFAYLYRIKIGNQYLLVQNTRNTGKYQPVGGVYKIQGNEKNELKNLFQIKDDNKIPIDESSRDDYRLRMENKYLRRFVKRFDKKANRERINNVSREFKEELVDTGILNWNAIKYRFCGRHMTELQFGEHFQIYELLLADIVELIPTSEQEQDLKRLMGISSEKYKFATAEEITCLGMDTESGYLYEWIADHTKKILQENEKELTKIKDVGEIYAVHLSENI